MSLCYKYRCAVCGQQASSTRKDARYCKRPTCRRKASEATARGEEYVAPTGKPTTATLRSILAESPDLLRSSLKAKHPLTLLAPTSGPDPFPISDHKSNWLVTCSLGVATLVAIRGLQAALVDRQIKGVGVLVCKSFAERHLKACRKRGIMALEYNPAWLSRPHTTRIVANRSAPTVVNRSGGYGSGTPSRKRSHPGANSDKESLLKQESLAWATNYDRCGRCAAAGDAQVILICASCRRPYCKSCMSRDAEGYWRCRRCAGKVKQADSPILPWIEEPISEQRARAKGDARDARALIKVIRCACGWGFNSQLEQGIVECRCGRAFSLADAKRIVATVQPRGRSLGAKTKELVGAGAVRGGIGAVCKPHQTAGSTPTAVSASASTGSSLVPSPLGCR